MIEYIIIVILEIVCLGLVLAAGGLWTGASLSTRPKYKDEQTLIGGSIWSQIIIPIGLIISMIVEEPLDDMVLGYFFASGSLLMFFAAFSVISNECRILKRSRALQRTETAAATANPPTDNQKKQQSAWQKRVSVINRGRPIDESNFLQQESYDRIYFGIGLLLMVASVFKLLELLLIIIL